MRRLGVLLAAAAAVSPLRATAQDTPVVPFQAGLQLTWSMVTVGEPDYEAVLTVLTVDSAEATIRWSWNRGRDRLWKEAKRHLSTRERQRSRSSYFYASEGDRNEYRGSTPGMISATILEELGASGQADVVWLLPQLSSRPFRGTLQRVGSGTEGFDVLLDGQPVTLPGIRVHADLAGEFAARIDALFLDDPEASWELQSSGETDVENIDPVYSRLVRIETGARESRVSGALEEDCRASVHDIYFATGSDALDATSAPALEAIAATLASHPEWSVTIIGHTDDQGSEESNLDLSSRRAARVVTTLVGEYGIEAGRLHSEGRGETEPVADNGTPEGRAQNRRVELERPCGGTNGTGG